MIAAAFLPLGQEPANSQIEPKSPRPVAADAELNPLPVHR